MPADTMLTLKAHESYSYVPRTRENAHEADATVAFAVDFTTAGERLTKREASPRYVGIRFGTDVALAASTLASYLSSSSPRTELNVAGNGIYTMAEHGFTQAQCNQWVYEVLHLVTKATTIALIRSGGQTGIDQAGLVAALALGIPALGLYPASFRRRNAQGQEVTASANSIRAELEAQVGQLQLAPLNTAPEGLVVPSAGIQANLF